MTEAQVEKLIDARMEDLFGHKQQIFGFLKNHEHKKALVKTATQRLGELKWKKGEIKPSMIAEFITFFVKVFAQQALEVKIREQSNINDEDLVKRMTEDFDGTDMIKDG